MLKGSRSFTSPQMHESVRDWPAWTLVARGKRQDKTGRPVLRNHAALRAILLIVPCLVTGAIGGSVAGAALADRAAHRKGACAALHMAAAHGYLDERQQRVIMRTLATAINPDVESFPGGYRAMREACRAVGGRS